MQVVYKMNGKGSKDRTANHKEYDRRMGKIKWGCGVRENKFRLRNCINKIVGYEKWYPGSLDSKNFYIAKPCWLYSKDGKIWDPTPIQHRYKDQYTGLKAKRGKEVYEGDIINAYKEGCKQENIKLNYEVLFYYGCFKLAVLPRKIRLRNLAAPFVDNDLKILGNRFENPELLEV